MKDKMDWMRYYKSLRDDFMCEIFDSKSNRMFWHSMKFKDTVFESPKVYFNNIAVNVKEDWLKFDTMYRTKDGKPKKIFLPKMKPLARMLMLFCRFQKMLGFVDENELVYHMAYFLSTVPVVPDGVFEVNDKNIELLHKIARRILATDASEKVLEELKDGRKFCIDPKCKGLPPEDMKVLTNKGRRITNLIQIKRRYDDSKSKSENAKICEVSISSIARYRKFKEAVDRLYQMYANSSSMSS